MNTREELDLSSGSWRTERLSNIVIQRIYFDSLVEGMYSEFQAFTPCHTVSSNRKTSWLYSLYSGHLSFIMPQIQEVIAVFKEIPCSVPDQVKTVLFGSMAGMINCTLR